MLYKVELNTENVRKIVDFIDKYTVVPSSLDGTSVFMLIVHNDDAEKAREICNELNEGNEFTIMSKYYEYDFGEFNIEEADNYGFFVKAL